MTSTLTVTWQTLYADSGASVAYDNISHNGDFAQYGYEANGSSHTYNGASGYVRALGSLKLAKKKRGSVVLPR
jgi:hypothetical protein